MTGVGAIGARAIGDAGSRDLPGEWGGADVRARRAASRREAPPAAARRSVVRRP